ncbi:MAG: hypothetical protein HRU18_06810 [Pseudoalteromonas sp.]|uniref:hypothetical protein n=1 Tax=Pseudoalteromonas sp. TaxID=53249 RepID=UPI001D264D5D|nr:hypothetical protein [Pseudoalteromonas sp.]NRA77901.1 hypothetical protein [Pseudoalteromonas sp.]
MRTMKAYNKTPELSEIAYPVIGSPKLDGFRCYAEGGIVCSQGGNPIVNNHTRELLKGLPDLDGELMLVSGDFEDNQSAFMSVHGKPEFKFNVFDHWSHGGKFKDRLEQANQYVNDLNMDIVVSIPHNIITSPEAAKIYWDAMVAEGHEGMMTRDPYGPYKHGRSTLNQGYLLKFKHWIDTEGVIVGFEEETDVNGVPKGHLGKFIVEWEGKRIPVAGFELAYKIEVWANKSKYLGLTETFKYQNKTRYGMPRFPIHKGIRYD